MLVGHTDIDVLLHSVNCGVWMSTFSPFINCDLKLRSVTFLKGATVLEKWLEPARAYDTISEGDNWLLIAREENTDKA